LDRSRSLFEIWGVDLHEISLVEEVLAIIQQSALRDSFTKVHEVTIEIGKLSCVEVEAFVFVLENQKQGSMLESAEIKITRPDGAAICNECNTHFKLIERWDSCPECKSNQISITEGEQLKIIDLIVSS